MVGEDAMLTVNYANTVHFVRYYESAMLKISYLIYRQKFMLI